MTDAPVDVAILTEAGPVIGYGHLGRCVALYDAFEREGVRPRLVVRGAPDSGSLVAGGQRLEMGEWLEEHGLDEHLDRVAIAVVDSYEAPEPACEAIARAVEVVLWLDDTCCFEYPAGIVLNGAVRADTLPYARRTGVSYLLGPRYQPLRREFWQPPPRATRERIERALVVFGGSDVRGLGQQVAEALIRSAVAPSVELVDGSYTASGMRDAMEAADIAVSAGGQTLFELAAMGVPTVAITVADNQRENVAGWEAAGFVRSAGMWDDPGVVDRAVETARGFLGADARQRAAESGSIAVDGMGALRVARHVLTSLEASRLEVRHAGLSDEDDLLKLVNDPYVRGASFSTRSITPDEHAAWLADRLRDPHSLLLVAEDGEGLIGQFRFDLAGQTATVSLSLSRRARGRGLGRPLLERALVELQAAHPEAARVRAEVRAENEPSRSLFLRAGFAESCHELIDGCSAALYERVL